MTGQPNGTLTHLSSAQRARVRGEAADAGHSTAQANVKPPAIDSGYELEAGVVSRESAQIQEAAAGQSGGAIQADQAAIQAAKVNLNYTKITSPINGVVGLRQVDPGNIVHASDTNGLLEEIGEAIFSCLKSWAPTLTSTL